MLTNKTLATKSHPASGKCVCGARVRLESTDENECPSCGRVYNLFGQELKQSQYTERELLLGLDN